MELTILSDFQKKILDYFKKTSLVSKFYLSGGTALSEFYLKHRKSEDMVLAFILFSSIQKLRLLNTKLILASIRLARLNR